MLSIPFVNTNAAGGPLITKEHYTVFAPKIQGAREGVTCLAITNASSKTHINNNHILEVSQHKKQTVNISEETIAKI